MPKGRVLARGPRAAPKRRYNDSIFVNCPFDAEYEPIFHAIVFAIHDCGYVARCALEAYDSGDVRIEKILDIIDQCRLGIHDISRTELNEHGLPRFNMPLELGLFLGARRWERGKTKKIALILDLEPHRYQIFCSDISGQDIQVHKKMPIEAIKVVRNWLRSDKPRVEIPGGSIVAKRYGEFVEQLPELKKNTQLGEDELTFADYVSLLIGWLKQNDWKPSGKKP
jgi:hypothetical protein